jgi:hypothetical protein
MVAKSTTRFVISMGGIEFWIHLITPFYSVTPKMLAWRLDSETRAARLDILEVDAQFALVTSFGWGTGAKVACLVE